MTISAIFGALCFVVNAFLKIPYLADKGGYFNFGDVFIIFISIYIGPIEGILVGLIGGIFGDLYSGYANFIPFTIVAKTLMAFVSGFFFQFFKNNRIRFLKYIFPFIGAILMAATYLPSYWIYLGFNQIYFAGFDLIQGVGCAIIAIALYIPFRKLNLLSINQNDY